MNKGVTVGKMGLAGASLIAAIPGLLLVALLLQGLVLGGNLGSLPMLLMIAAMALLAVSVLIAIFPLYALVWHRGAGVAKAPKPKKEKKDKKSKSKAKADDDATSAVPTGDLHTQDAEIEGEFEDAGFESDDLEGFSGHDSTQEFRSDDFEDEFVSSAETIEDDSFEEYGDGLSTSVETFDDDDDFFNSISDDEHFEFEDFDEDEDDKKK